MPYEIYTFRVLAWCSALLGPSKNRLALCLDNVTEWDIDPVVVPVVWFPSGTATIKSPAVHIITSQYLSWYDLWCYQDVKLQQPKPNDLPRFDPSYSTSVLMHWLGVCCCTGEEYCEWLSIVDEYCRGCPQYEWMTKTVHIGKQLLWFIAIVLPLSRQRSHVTHHLPSQDADNLSLCRVATLFKAQGDSPPRNCCRLCLLPPVAVKRHRWSVLPPCGGSGGGGSCTDYYNAR